ncbi:MAG: thioredoxin family protein [Alteromonadaceae bacterium]|nr:MAG: thioredoxin family protein [Alteromonadaceae bacterium]
MAAIESTMMPLTSIAPAFSLPDTEGKTVSLNDAAGKQGTVILFICNHCPYVKHIAPALAELAKQYQDKGIAFIAINSNDIDAYPEDDLAHMKIEKQTRDYIFPYLLDETQAVAHAYGAACTPDLYFFGAEKELVYRGQFDDSRPHRISSGNYDSTKTPSSGESLSKAIDQLLSGEQIDSMQRPSIGCNIKWKPGNAPDDQV